MHHARPHSMRSLGKKFGRNGIDGMREFDLGFGAINGGVGCGVHDDAWFNARHER